MTRPRTTVQDREVSSKSGRTGTPKDGQRHHAQIERALIIHPEPLEWILSGKKTWEIRTRTTKIRGPIALQEKGTKRILGTCRLVDCLGPLTVDEFFDNPHKMNLMEAELEDEREELEEELEYGLYAWVLADVKRLPKPIRFENPSGAVTWARLPQRVMDKLWLVWAKS
jgi:hypothetical protein